MTKSRISAYLLLLLVSIIWGIAGPIIKYTLNYFSPQVFLTYRFFLSALVAFGYFTLYPTALPKTKGQTRHTMAHSIFTILFGLGLLFFGFELTNSLTGTLLAATGPIFSILLGAIMLREHVTRQEIVGLFLAISGSLLITITADTRVKIGFLGTAMFGNALILLSRITDALGGVSAKFALKHGMQPVALSHISFVVGFLVFAVISIAQYGALGTLREIIHAPLAGHLGVIYMSFVSGTLGYAIFNMALQRIELGEASLFSYLTVLWGAPLAIIWLGDPLTPQFAVGGTIIAIGVALAEWKRRKSRLYNGYGRRRKSVIK